MSKKGLRDILAGGKFPVWLLPGILFFGYIYNFSSSHYSIGGRGVETDFYWDYAPAADAIVNGELPIKHLHFRGPGYPLVLASLSWVRGTFFAGKIVTMLSASVVVSIFGYLLIARFGIVFGLIGVATLIANGLFLEYSIRVGTDMFFLMLNLIVVLLLVKDKSPWVPGIAGFVAGWGFLTRYNGVALLLTVCCWILYTYYCKNGAYIRKCIGALIGMAFPVITWLIIYYFNTDSKFPNSNLSNVFYEIESSATGNWDQYWYGKSNGTVSDSHQLNATNLVLTLKSATANIYHNFYADMELVSGDTLTAMALGGLVIILFRQLSSGAWLWGMIAGIFNYCILLFVFHSPRFSLCLTPVYIVSALFFFDWLRQKLLPYGNVAQIGLIIIAVILLLVDSAPQTWQKTKAKFDNSNNYIYEISQNVSVNHLPEGKLAARKPHLAYLLKMPFVVLPILNDPAELLDWMNVNEISYLFLDSYGGSVRPGISSLLGRNKNLNGLDLIYFREGTPKAGYWALKQSDN